MSLPLNSIEILVDRADRVFRPGDKVTGAIAVNCPGPHNGVWLRVDGSATLQSGQRSLLDSSKPVEIMHMDIIVAKATKLTDGTVQMPFEFKVEPSKNSSLVETYHGVYVNVAYQMTAELVRSGLMAKPLKKTKEFFVEIPPDATLKKGLSAKPFQFKINQDSLQNVKESLKNRLPEFEFSGQLTGTTCDIARPFTGELTITACKQDIKSIELQLVRVESVVLVSDAPGQVPREAREATEIQNVQLADGNVRRGVPIPIYMVFPRTFVCATAAHRMFKLDFEVNLIIQFADNLIITENFPLKLTHA